MTKKKALKSIMAYGIQRNEAQKRLLAWHQRGFTNFDSAFMIIILSPFTQHIISAKKARKHLQRTFALAGVTTEELADGVKKMAEAAGGFPYENHVD